MFLKLLPILTLLLSDVLVADDFKLDPAPAHIQGVIAEPKVLRFPGFSDLVDGANDLAALVGFQTPVKAQGMRGTCSIFSSAGEVESLLKIRDGKVHDLSENYLEFLAQAKVKSSPSGGSDTFWNIPAMQRHGIVLETDFPYDNYDWLEEDIPSYEKKRAEKTCGHLKGRKKTVCLYGHLDPDEDPYKESAVKLRNELNLHTLSYATLYSQKQIKRALNENRPLLLGIRFFYKAWNHRKMVEYGLGERNMEAWGRGEVSTPTKEDIEISEKHSAGHSIIIVGYNDEKQVYYFKNSWGTGNFGVNSDLLGAGTTDGYGTITYDYAHTYGTFHLVTVQ